MRVLVEQMRCAGMRSEEMLRDHAAENVAGHTAQHAARQQAAEPQSTSARRTGADATEGAFDRTGLPYLGTRGGARQRSGTVAGRLGRGAFGRGHLFAQPLQDLLALLWRQRRERFGMCLLDRLGRRCLQQIAIPRDRLLVGGGGRCAGILLG